MYKVIFTLNEKSVTIQEENKVKGIYPLVAEDGYQINLDTNSNRVTLSYIKELPVQDEENPINQPQMDVQVVLSYPTQDCFIINESNTKKFSIM